MRDESEHLLADIPLKAIIEYEGKVLIVMNSERAWQLPGGRLNKGERPIDGLKREIKEELDASVEVLSIYDTFVFTSSSGKAHFLVIYICKLLSDAVRIRDVDGEAKEMRWISSPEELKNLGNNSMMWKEYHESLVKYFTEKAN